MNGINNPIANEFLDKVQAIFQKTEELNSISQSGSSVNPTKNIQLMTEKLSALPESELIEAHDALCNIPEWPYLSDSVDDAIEKAKKALTPTIKEYAIMVSSQSDCTLGNCPSGPSQLEVDDLLIAAAAVDLSAAVAQAIADTLDIFKITELAGKIAKAIASGLTVAAKSLALAAEVKQRAVDVTAECEDEAMKQLLINMCTTINIIDTKIDKITAKLEIMDQKLDNIYKLLQEVKDVVDEILLHQIEEALTECQKLVGLYLPEENSGSINKVKDIVEQLIYYSKLSGLTTANSQSYWRQGCAALENGQYEIALQWFMLAYKQLQSKDMCKVPSPCDPCN